MSARALILSTWSVSVSNNKITQTSGLNSFFFFLIVLEVGESKIKVSANLALDEDSPPGLKMTICILTEQSGRKLRCLLSGHWSDHRGSTLVTSSKPNYLPKAIHLIPSYWGFSSVQFSSVAQSCPTLCDPMDCSMPGLPVHHQLLEFTQTHVHWVNDAIQPSHPLSSPSHPTFNLFQHQGLFKWVSSSHQVAEVLEFQHWGLGLHNMNLGEDTNIQSVIGLI